MTYVALLRGINVGGNRIVPMRRLAEVVTRAGMREVRTYINSGNVIFESDRPAAELAGVLEAAIADEFGFPVMVIVRDASTLASLAAAIPADWVNDDRAKCDVMFLADDIDTPGLMDLLTIKDGIDEVFHAHGAVVWHVERRVASRSGMMKLVGTDLYARMTVRNCNTARTLAARAGGTGASEAAGPVDPTSNRGGI